MWDSISEEITEEFESFCGDGGSEGCSYTAFRPRLNEEADMQGWHNHILLSRPAFVEGRDMPQTCIRVATMKWKNQHGEGKWFAVSAAVSWGEQDYAEMASTPCGIDIWTQPKPAKPVREIEAETATETVIVPLEPTKRVRIQVTMREGGEYVAGKNGNFQVSGADGERVAEILRPLDVAWPRCLKPQRSVRVQIQNLVGGKMSGGGNYQLHNADVPEVLAMIGGLVEGAGLKVEKRSKGVEAGAKPESAEVSSLAEELGIAVPKAKPVGMAVAWDSWKDATDACLKCGCGETGSCLCRALEAR